MRALKLIAIIAVTASPLLSQTVEPITRDRLTFDVAGGMSRYGPHAFGGLEIAMQRWLALRGEGLFALHSRQSWPEYRHTALSLSAVVSYKPGARVSPYLLGGYGLSVSRGSEPRLGPLGGGGLRFRFGRVQPFVEVRAQPRIGVPLSFGIRF